MAERPIYLDYNATTPVDPSVLEVMMPYFNQHFGNASSLSHAFGWEAQEAVDRARDQVSELINAKPKEIFFTSGATESLNLVINSLISESHVIASSTEHQAVLDPLENLKKNGHDITLLSVNSDGTISLGELVDSIKPDTRLVVCMLGNNETGVIQPIKEISEITRKNNIPLLVDATQAVGKIPVNVADLGVDLMAFSSHKMYGPKGIGALYLNSDTDFSVKPQLLGGGHENGLRSGTLNIPAIVGFGKACELAMNLDDMQRLSQLRDELEKELELHGAIINGKPASRLPNVANVSFPNIDGTKLIRRLSKLAVSQGSACHSSVTEPSHVLTAMGVSKNLVLSSLRISFGRPTTKKEVDQAIDHIKATVESLHLQSV